MKLNRTLFIDIESCLISTKSGKDKPISLHDWKFNDTIIRYMKANNFDFICLVADRYKSDIVHKKKYTELITFVQEMLSKGVESVVNVVFYDITDTYFNYPNPGAIFSFAIDNDVDLSNSIYVSGDDKASKLSCVGKKYSLSEFILNV